MKNHYLISMSPDEIIENVIKTAQLLRMDVNDYKKEAITIPRIPTKYAEKIEKRIDINSGVLGVSRDEFTKMARLTPRILMLKSEHLEDTRSNTLQVLQIDDNATYAEMVKKNPYILTTRPEHINLHLNEFALFFEKTKSEIVDKAIDAPILLTTVPALANKNFEDFKNEIGLNENICKELAFKNPRILTQKQNVLKRIIEENAKTLDLSREEYIELGQINSNLFTARPASIQRFKKEGANFLNLDDDLFKKAVEKGVKFTTEYQKTDKYIISVPTPYDKFTKRIDA